MKFHIMTLFPELVTAGLSGSITGRAMEKGIISLDAVNIRDYAENKSRHVDDYTFGGGAGMLMMADPVVKCHEEIVRRIGKPEKKIRTLYMTPTGRVFCQSMAEELAREEELILLCGHYEGIDERAIALTVTDEISIGDFVLTGGELPAMLIVDAVTRLLPGALGSDESAVYESFYDGLLEYPQYTRPRNYRGLEVPEVLLSGDHKKIEEWRLEQAVERTRLRRPDLYEAYIRKK